jgi:hypothetical protein
MTSRRRVTDLVAICHRLMPLLLAGAATGTALAEARCPTADCDPARLVRRTLHAASITGPPPMVDGRLDDPAWANAEVATDFIEGRPRPGAASPLPSEARVVMDADALYVALTYLDPQPERIQAPLLRRDDESTSDWAFVEIDSRRDRRSAFSFGVNPRGVLVDGLWYSDIAYDGSWNAVWAAAATTGPRGWTAEFRIPFSQLPFQPPPAGEPTRFGINFYRYSPHHGGSSNWAPRFSGLAGVVSNFNDLELAASPSPRRLEATPYLAPRLETGAGAHRDESVAAGADFRVGLGSSFTLTGTVLPDFGQVEADPAQVNLTAFELFQPERRPFFLEGLDLFRFDTSLPFTSRDVSFANESPFYSRRIGSAPRGGPPPGGRLLDSPDETTLLGAVKVAGETRNGWALGLFSALTDEENADARGELGDTFSWPIQPRAAISIARAVRARADGDAMLGLFVADLDRLGLDRRLADQFVRDSVTVGVEGRRKLAARRYELRGWSMASRLTGSEPAIARVAESPRHLFQRPDAPSLHDRPYGTSLSGVAAETSLARVEGSFLWDLRARTVSPGFDVDEVGFQRQSNWLLLAGSWKLERFPATGRLRGWTVGSENVGLGWTWRRERRAAVADAYLALDFRNYWSTRVRLVHELSALSIERLRGGPALLLPPRDGVTVSLVSDQRRASTASLDVSAAREPGSDSWAASVAPGVDLRTSERLRWNLAPSYGAEVVGWQPVGTLATGTRTEYLVGRVAERTLAIGLRADVVFTPRLVVQLYARPFATTGRYDRFQLLAAPRAASASARFTPLSRGQVTADPGRGLLSVDLDGDGAVDGAVPLPGGEERSLDANVVLRWEYLPGSSLIVAWNQRRSGGANVVGRSPSSALRDLGDDPATTVAIVKLSFRLGT